MFKITEKVASIITILAFIFPQSRKFLLSTIEINWISAIILVWILFFFHSRLCNVGQSTPTAQKSGNNKKDKTVIPVNQHGVEVPIKYNNKEKDVVSSFVAERCRCINCHIPLELRKRGATTGYQCIKCNKWIAKDEYKQAVGIATSELQSTLCQQNAEEL